MKKLIRRCVAMIVIVSVVFGTVNSNPIQTQAKESKDYTIKVNLGTNCTTIYKNGKAIKAMICSPSAETPTGTFYIPVKYRWHDMIGNCYAQYCSRITTGILFHSVWYYKKYDKSTMSVSAYNVMGQKASHGCVRLLCKDAKWIYDHCAVGTKIVIFWGKKKDDPIKRPSFTPISTGAFTSWDPTDSDPKNPYQKVKPTIKQDTKTVEFGKKVKPINLVTIKDCVGNELTKENAKIKISGKINTKKLGKYKIKYFVKDSLGNKQTKSFTFRVTDTKKPVIQGAKSRKNIPMGSSRNILSGIKAKAVSGRNLTSAVKASVTYKKAKVKVSKGKVTFAKNGTYKITYKVMGANKKTAIKTITYKVNDQRVKIALKNSIVNIKQGSSFDPYEYINYVTTYDGKAINSKTNVSYKGNVDTSKPGTYIVQYTAKYKNRDYTARTISLKVVVEESEEETTTPEVPTTGKEETTTGEEVPTTGEFGESGSDANETSGWTEFA